MKGKVPKKETKLSSSHCQNTLTGFYMRVALALNGLKLFLLLRRISEYFGSVKSSIYFLFWAVLLSSNKMMMVMGHFL